MHCVFWICCFIKCVGTNLGDRAGMKTSLIGHSPWGSSRRSRDLSRRSRDSRRSRWVFSLEQAYILLQDPRLVEAQAEIVRLRQAAQEREEEVAHLRQAAQGAGGQERPEPGPSRVGGRRPGSWEGIGNQMKKVCTASIKAQIEKLAEERGTEPSTITANILQR